MRGYFYPSVISHLIAPGVAQAIKATQLFSRNPTLKGEKVNNFNVLEDNGRFHASENRFPPDPY